MLSLEQAVAQILAALPAPRPEAVPLSAAFGRIALAEISAPIDLPRFDNSAMDGYAVRAAVLVGASAEQPVALQLCGQASAGEVLRAQVEPGACARIFTGSALPAGADAVVMQEDTRVDKAAPERVWFLEPVKPWENVRFRGEDVKHGTALLKPGERISAGRLSLLGATGLSEVMVGKQPTVGVLATGSELQPAGCALAPGQIYESNRFTLAALATQAGVRPIAYPLVPDDLESTQAALERACAECDLVITSGGVSVGELDFVKRAWERIGGELAFWKVALRPGKPFVFGRLRDKFLFGLPGNPVSAFVTFLLLVRPALARWQGATDTALPSHPGILGQSLVNPGDRRHFVRVKTDAAGFVRAAGTQGSHILSSLAEAEGLVDVPPQGTLAAGTPVKVYRWE